MPSEERLWSVKSDQLRTLWSHDEAYDISRHRLSKDIDGARFNFIACYNLDIYGGLVDLP